MEVRIKKASDNRPGLFRVSGTPGNSRTEIRT